MNGGKRTVRLSSAEIERMRVAAENGDCVECARLHGEIEARRLERHQLHKQIAKLEAAQEIISKQVQVLAAKVAELVS
jgi:hypothetical protein